ncbi:tetratricopeptide repeat protein [Mycoplasmatota bacterium WC30]
MAITKTPKQLNDIGDQYFYGKNKQKNIEMAFTYYKQAADLNNPVGYFNVGKYFIEKKQYKQAGEYLIKAKELGFTKASIQLSKLYLNGLGYRRNKKKAFKFLNQAVEENDISAMHQLGIFYLKGIGCKKDEKLALKYFELSSENKVAEGMRFLGSLYLDAKQIKRDYENGFFWLDKAAVAGDIEAINRLKKLYKESHPFLRKKSLLYLQEMEFYYDELLAKKDDVDALIRVGFTYYEGNQFTKINYEKANIYFAKLYDLDHTMGYLGLGLTKLFGRGIETNYEEAKNLLEIASTRGDIQAMNALGEIHRLGYGVTINYQRAKDYYFEAAKSDETNALINLGLLNYRKQIQGSKNELAYQYMLTAADKGNALAYYWLGIFYDKGVGTTADFKKAELFFKKAIEANNLGAGYKYAQMLFEHVQTTKLNRKKKNLIYEEIRKLLINYINSPHTSDVNSMYSMYTLGELYNLDNFDLKSNKISRYYFELAAEKKMTKAMVRMYFILREKEPKVAVNLIQEAIKRPSDGEALYEMANLLYEGHELIEKNELKAKEFYGKAAALNYQPAKEKLAML